MTGPPPTSSPDPSAPPAAGAKAAVVRWPRPGIRRVAERRHVDLFSYVAILFVVSVLALSVMPLLHGALLIWPATPIAVATLSRNATRRWPILSGVTFATLITAGLVAGVPPVAVTIYAVIDIAVILTVAGMLRRINPDSRLLRGYGMTIVTALFGATLSTLLAMAFSRLWHGGIIPYHAVQWFASSAMGLIVLLPALKVTRRALAEELDTLSPKLILPIAVTTIATSLVFFAGGNPSLFLLLPCSVFAALFSRFVGVSVSTLIVAGIATVATLHGVGPIVGAFDTIADRILFLQLFVAIVALTSFPVASLLYEQSRAMNEIRDNERQLRMMTDYSTDLIVRIGRDGVRRYASPASMRLLGYTPEEMIGRTPYASIHPDDRNRVRRQTYALVPGGESTVFRYRMQHRDGHYVWLEGAFRLIGDSRYNCEMIGSIRDIGQRRAAESKAIESVTQLEEQQRLLAMAESAARLGHWRLNLMDRRNLWSPEIFRIHGLPQGEEPSLEASINFYHPEDRAMVRAQIDRAIATGGSFAFDARLVRRDGTIRWVASRGQAERGQGAEVVGLFGVLQDTTEQVAAMSDLRAAREDAERALAAKAIFTATISHEIRTPLTSILAAVQLLRDTPNRSERMRHLDSLEQAGRTLSDIVDDVLTFSKLEGGHSDPEAIVFEPRELLAMVTGMFAAEAERHAVSLDFDVPDGRVIGDPARLQRVLTNLVGNAVKFTRAGSIHIAATRDVGDCWRFEVTDTGVGIRDDRLDAIFEPFVQADASTTRSYGGTGLGLSISRMLVESMGGNIGVVSRPGTGSRFWFHLPLPVAGGAGLAAEVSVPGLNADLSGEREGASSVLVAEDNDTNRYLIAEIVRRLGHAVVTVENGARAVEYVTAAAGNPVDMVLMDVQMPVMDGIAATRAIRVWSGAGARVPIYALTADLSAERRAEVLDAGMNGVLTKPVDVAQLRAVLDKTAIPAERPSIPKPGAGAGAIDPLRVRSLTDALGSAQRDTLLSLLIDDAVRIPARLRTLIAHDRLNLARREAHALRGAAASMGAIELIAALQVIEDAPDEVPIDPAALDEIERCATAVIDAAQRAMAEPA
ncbi:PAS domain-containing protein [Sphingomonas sp. Leaf10]|uniref:PAS domain-containing protein n=1 Tax=Sphingomonas sp. Leaf10 TaxID=1735676 RepID=UPI000A761542|nr:PAS domain-containing protein [Sphingomonas sp. Leaf10]